MTTNKPLPEGIGVLYDREHTEGIGGYHDNENGSVWVDCINEESPGFTGESGVRISERILRAQGYHVPPFTGTPCPRCFPKEGGAP